MLRCRADRRCDPGTRLRHGWLTGSRRETWRAERLHAAAESSGLHRYDSDRGGHPYRDAPAVPQDQRTAHASGGSVRTQLRPYFRHHESRSALDVELLVEGQAVRVIVTHLGLGARERRYQVEKLLSALNDIPARRPVVLLGDINEWLPVGRPLRWLHGALGKAPSGRSFPVWAPLLALDRIWSRQPGTRSHVRGSHEPDCSRGVRSLSSESQHHRAGRMAVHPAREQLVCRRR